METWTFVTKRYSVRTCKALIDWIHNNLTSVTKCDILEIPMMKPSVVVITSDINDITKFKAYLKTITLV
jgi:hypothetical protein